jgi:O-antigen/teichoic acid export membrane protein
VQTAKQKFGRDVLLSSVATGVRLLRHVLILPVLTHSLDEIQLGLWEQIMVGVALLIPWVSLQLPGALVRFLPGVEDIEQRREITYSICLLAFVSSIVLASLLGLALHFSLPLSRWSPLLPVLPLITALTVASTGIESIRAYFRALRQIITHSALSIAQYFGELTLIAYALLGSGDIAVGLWALLAIRSLLFVLGSFCIIRQLGLSLPSFAHIRAYLNFSIPLIPTSALYRFFDAGDRYLLAHFLGHASVGIYYISYTAASFFTTLASPLHLVLLPALAELWNSGQKGKIAEYISDIIGYTTLLSLPLLVFTLVLPREILQLITPDAYGESARYLPILALGFFAFCLGVPGDHLLVASGRTRLLFYINSAMVTINIILNLVLIPRIGISGAAYSTLAGHLLYSLTVLTLTQRITNFSLPWRSIALTLFHAVLMGFILILIKPHLPPLAAAVISGATYILLCIITSLFGRREWDFLRQILQRP